MADDRVVGWWAGCEPCTLGLLAVKQCGGHLARLIPAPQFAVTSSGIGYAASGRRWRAGRAVGAAATWRTQRIRSAAS
jgi:hypothetical protein